jgi:hypothetical protein
MTDILQEASELINGERAKNYGPARENFQKIADLFAAYLGDTDTDDLGPYDVANLMILVKLARIKNAGYHRDSYADIAGYAALAEKINNTAELAPYQGLSKKFWDEVDESILEINDRIDAATTQKPAAGE